MSALEIALALALAGAAGAAWSWRRAWRRALAASTAPAAIVAPAPSAAPAAPAPTPAVDPLDAAPFPAWRRDADGQLVWVNTRYREMVEAEPARILAEQIELASGLDPEQPRRLARKALDGGGGRATETRRFVVAGDRRSYRIHETVLPDGGTAGFGQDTTPEEDARGQLRRHVEAHGEVLQNLATAIAVYSPDKRLTMYNRAYAKLWRLDEVWLASQPRYGEVLEALREARRLPEQIDWQHFKRGQLDLFTAVLEPREEWMHLPDGSTLRVVVTPHPLGGLLFTYEDVTDRLLLERDRNTLAAVQRATLDNLYEGVVVYRGDGRVGLYNAAFAKLWGVDEATLAAEPHITEVIDAARTLMDDGDDWPAKRDELMEAYLHREGRMGRMERHDGSILHYAAMPLPDGAMLFTYLDVTDSARIERALRERNEALQAADQLKSEFIANVSYELRTPLNAIIGFAELLNSKLFGALNDKQREYGDNIVDSAHQLLMLVNDMLDLAIIEAGHMALEPNLFDPYPVIGGILALTRERARRQNLTVEMDCPPDIGGIVADERRIKQVLFNLISNAIKFTPPGGRILVTARRAGDDVTLVVSDNGIGIPEPQQTVVFEKFRKSGSGTRQPGIGVGLALVRSFVELHGGTVALHSATGQGTTVTCTLPARTAPGTLVSGEGSEARLAG